MMADVASSDYPQGIFYSSFEKAPPQTRRNLLTGLLSRCTRSELSHIARSLAPLLKADPASRLSAALTLKIFRHLDAQSLGNAAQVSRKWQDLANSDEVWYYLCSQHINKQCTGCGLGLPLLDKGRNGRKRRADALLPPADACPSPKKTRQGDDAVDKSERDPLTNLSTTPAANSLAEHKHQYGISASLSIRGSGRKTWKQVFTERLLVELNWRHGRYTLSRIKNAHPEGTLTLQFDERCNRLITGGYDTAVKIWDLETGEMLMALKGHTKAVRVLRFDECKLATAGDDETIRLWDWRKGICTRVLPAHTAVLSLDMDDCILASGGADGTVRVWDFESGKCSTLRWADDGTTPSAAAAGRRDHEEEDMNGTDRHAINALAIWRRTRLFAGGQDGVVRLWCLPTLNCIRTFDGHAGPITGLSVSLASWFQSSTPAKRKLSPSTSTPLQSSSPATSTLSTTTKTTTVATATTATPKSHVSETVNGNCGSDLLDTRTVLCTSSLDGAVKLFSVAGSDPRCFKTLYGHSFGIWSVASDSLRVASGAHDGELRVWDAASKKDPSTVCVPKIHDGAIFVASLGDTRVVTGGSDGDVVILDFSKKKK